MLYYIHDRNAPGLRSVPVGGGEETTVIESARLGNWGLTRDGIYFGERPEGAAGNAKPVLKFYDFQTRKVSPAAELDYYGNSTNGFSVTPDGRWLLGLRVNRRGSDLFLMDNFH